MEWSNVFSKGLEKVDYMKKAFQGKFPHITKDGKWLLSDEGHWTGGFWAGLLWLDGLYPQPDNERLAQALEQAKRLSGRTKDNKTHDMGFIFGPGCIMGNRISPNQDLIGMALSGANNLKHLYDKESGVLYAWDEPGYEGVAIVDSIMNLPVLIWASQQSGDPALYDMAIKLADNIGLNHIRRDFSTYHVVRWNPATREIAERTTHQGHSSDSCWSRGQSWALYGFANMYRYSSIEKYLDYARNLAEYFWSHLDEKTSLPKWDFFFQNNSEEPWDAAAGSIASSGMLLLSQLLKLDHPDESVLWKKRAEKMMKALVSNCFYTRLDEYGIIRQVTVDRPRNSGVNESSMYGDYYFMEAVYRLLNADNEEALKKLY